LKKIIISIVLIIFATACTTIIPVKVRKPAELNIGSARTIAVMEFDFLGSWDFSAGDKNSDNLKQAIVNAIAKKKDRKPLQPKAAYPGVYVSNELVAKLVQNGYYTVIERSKINDVLKEQSLTLSGLVDEEQAVEIGNMIGAQALITGSGSYSVKDEGEWETYTEKKKNKDGKKVKVKKKRYNITRHVSAQITFRIIDVNTGSVVASKTNKASNKSRLWKYRSSGKDEASAAAGLKDWKPIVEGLVSKILDKTVKQIAPHTVTQKREIEEGESKKMKSAVEYAKRDLWEEAKEIWKKVLVSKKSEKEDHIAATYNMGLYFEIFGFFDDAENFYEEAYKLSDDSKYLDARARVKKRRKEVEKLRLQEEE
jgi:curli biogenesis system outer membrane secretion channel CsgG